MTPAIRTPATTTSRPATVPERPLQLGPSTPLAVMDARRGPSEQVARPAIAIAPEPVRVVLADDNARFRQGLARSFAARSDIEVVGEASDGAEALELLVRTRPAIAVVDARMPGLSGIELARAVARVPVLRGLRVVLLSATLDEQLVAEAAAAGVVACLDKARPRREIRAAVVAAAPDDGAA
ncbi:response regulator transcription factor [Patulibacter sp. S7RM1-6]